MDMAKIENEAAYQAELRRVEQLVELVDHENPVMDNNAKELDMLIDMIEEYEDVQYPVGGQPGCKYNRDVLAGKICQELDHQSAASTSSTMSRSGTMMVAIANAMRATMPEE